VSKPVRVIEWLLNFVIFLLVLRYWGGGSAFQLYRCHATVLDMRHVGLVY
jgi:hypothetical protein